MREWPNRAVSKTVVSARAPWVRIPLPPPSRLPRSAPWRGCRLTGQRVSEPLTVFSAKLRTAVSRGGRTNMGEPLTLPQAAQELGLHYMTVYRYVRTGRLPAKRARGTWQIDPRDLDMVRRGAPEPQRRGATLAKPSRARLEARLV